MTRHAGMSASIGRPTHRPDGPPIDRTTTATPLISYP